MQENHRASDTTGPTGVLSVIVTANRLICLSVPLMLERTGESVDLPIYAWVAVSRTGRTSSMSDGVPVDST